MYSHILKDKSIYNTDETFKDILNSAHITIHQRTCTHTQQTIIYRPILIIVFVFNLSLKKVRTLHKEVSVLRK